MEHIISSPKWFGLNFVPCPCCNSQLEPRPVDGEWNNVFCTFCDFACRYAIAPNTPYDHILAMRKSDLEDLLQLKKSLPPLMIHFKWEQEGISHEQIDFWPFIAYRFLKEEHRHLLDLKPDQIPDVVVFGNQFDIPRMTIYQSPSDEEIAEQIAKNWTLPIKTSRIQRKFKIGYAHAALIKGMVDIRLLQLGRITDESEETVDEDEEI